MPSNIKRPKNKVTRPMNNIKAKRPEFILIQPRADYPMKFSY